MDHVNAKRWRRWVWLVALGLITPLAARVARADDDLVVGVCRWEPGERPDANLEDQTDRWS